MPFHEEHKKRRGRNFAIGGALLLLVALFFLATIDKIREVSGGAG